METRDDAFNTNPPMRRLLVLLEDYQIEFLDRLAAEADIPRLAALRAVIDAAMEEFEIEKVEGEIEEKKSEGKSQ